ncbi:TPA: tRNA (N6-threonylcarbamoyladenosine(37)-N6)-methyltransferase TrmO [Candidatus Acetothermia bacterium]|nr:tRNA (N6-threonylcarbamoyladenosine(37)-N6)-methyltransferase TrmO [Candidatus Acetothermia bacterium]
MERIELWPVGVVEREGEGSAWWEELASRPCRIRVRPELREGLVGIEPGAKILVLFWLHRADRGRLLVHPRGDRTRPLRGVFSTRSPHRPNPIGATVVKVLAVDQGQGLLIVEGLDALDGSPVLDIKAASPRFDEGCLI